jgi:ferrous iron transport protein A
MLVMTNLVYYFLCVKLEVTNLRGIFMTLKDLKPGESGRIIHVYSNNLRKRIIDMGLTNGTLIKVKKLAPLGDPIEILVRGYLLTLRKAEAKTIEIEKIEVLA